DVNLQAGADSDRANKISIALDTLTSAGLGIDKLASYNIGIVDTTGENATDAIDVIGDALQQVSRQRAALGAVQNRLDHTIKNLDNIVENTTAAEAQIRDTDMAEEMVKYSNTNILQQAGQSMLAQANQSNQGVLSLLQG
ncbi:MAG: flagellar hook protein, partial [Lachnospiraceae bacterium]|nr:flagellar hook protein [Lachnospiraceae bacterium]